MCWSSFFVGTIYYWGAGLYTVKLMKELGFRRVYDLKGGIVAWQSAGLPIKIEERHYLTERRRSCPRKRLTL